MVDPDILVGSGRRKTLVGPTKPITRLSGGLSSHLERGRIHTDTITQCKVVGNGPNPFLEAAAAQTLKCGGREGGRPAFSGVNRIPGGGGPIACWRSSSSVRLLPSGARRTPTSDSSASCDSRRRRVVREPVKCPRRRYTQLVFRKIWHNDSGPQTIESQPGTKRTSRGEWRPQYRGYLLPCIQGACIG